MIRKKLSPIIHCGAKVFRDTSFVFKEWLVDRHGVEAIIAEELDSEHADYILGEFNKTKKSLDKDITKSTQSQI